MRLQDPLGIIAPTLDTKILKVLARADAWFNHKQLTEMTGGSRKGIYKVLQRLNEEGIVETLDRGNTNLVRLNREHLAAPAIIALADLRAVFIEKLQAESAAFKPKPVYAALFGSGARGEMRTDSDIDLFFLQPEDAGEDWDLQVHDLVAKASRWTGNDVRPLIFTVDEARGAAATESVIRAIADEGVPFAGSSMKFRKLVGAR